MSDNGVGTSGSTGSSAKGRTQAEDQEGTTTVPSGLHRINSRKEFRILIPNLKTDQFQEDESLVLEGNLSGPELPSRGDLDYSR